MTDPVRRLLAVLLALAVLAGPTGVEGVRLASADEAEDLAHTPPRLSFADGEVSFWRPGAEDWAPAQVNTPLAPGDELHTGYRGNLELQLHDQAFVRAWGDTHVGLTDQRPEVLQLRLTAGHLALDVRRLAPGTTVEVDAPHGALALEAPGYYRVDVGQQRTAFTVRGGGRGTLTLAAGAPLGLGAGEQVVLDGATVQRGAAPAPDVWDTWNETRTAHLLTTTGARYVASGVAGVADLDHHGTWRTEPGYGAVWVPGGVPAGWAPYSTGRWIADPHYGWTWLDTAPWGWAPYHYGRWVYLGGLWAWAPGPIVVRPVYAPALVAFFGSPGVSVTVATPFVSWVALGWGEPLVPWWRTSRFHGRPWWGGWGGPRIVNNVVVHRTTVIETHRITHYRNAGIRRAVVGVREDSFGRRPVHEARLRDDDLRDRRPIHGGPHVRPDRASFVPADGRGVRPPEATRSRPVVSRRSPEPGDGVSGRRPERPQVDRPRAEAPRGGSPRRDTPRVETPRSDTPRAVTPRVETPRADAPRAAGPRDTPRPGRPASEREGRGAEQAAPAPGSGPAPRPDGRERREGPVPRVETPRHVTPRVETPRVETPRTDTPRPVPRGQVPRVDTPRVETPRPDSPRGEPRRPEPRVESPRAPVPRADAPRLEPRRPEPPRSAPPSRSPDSRAVPSERRVQSPPPRPEPPRREVRPGGGREAQPRAATPAARREPGPPRAERGVRGGSEPRRDR